MKRIRERGQCGMIRSDRLLEANISANFDVEREIQHDICRNKEKPQIVQK
jgi:hypothetical protein